MRPGDRRTVKTLRLYFGWSANGPAPPNGRRSFAGEDYEVEVPQYCGATMTRAVVHCSTGGQAAVDLSFRPPRGRQVAYKIIDFHEVVRSGRAGADHQVRLWLPSGYYTLRAYTSSAVLPYERVDFEVVPCLRVQVRCDNAKFINSNEYPSYDVRVRTSAAGKASTVRVKGESRRRSRSHRDRCAGRRRRGGRSGRSTGTSAGAPVRSECPRTVPR